MAYLQRGLTESELRERWRQEAPVLSPDKIIARFGKPPYRWLGETVPSAPYNDTPTYAQQGRALLVDESGRQYVPVGSDDPMAANIRLPTSITVQQRSPHSTVPTSQLQAFPRIGETITLTPFVPQHHHQHQPRAEPAPVRMWTVRVRGVENARTASARILFHQRLPSRQEIETSSQSEQRDRTLARRLDGDSPVAAASSSSSASSSASLALAETRALRRFLAMDNPNGVTEQQQQQGDGAFTLSDTTNMIASVYGINHSHSDGAAAAAAAAVVAPSMSRKRVAQVALGV